MMALDPLKEANAAAKRMEAGMTTLPAETIGYDGGDWESNHKVSAKVQAMRVRDGLVPPVATMATVGAGLPADQVDPADPEDSADSEDAADPEDSADPEDLADPEDQ
jgi:capsid protein